MTASMIIDHRVCTRFDHQTIDNNNGRYYIINPLQKTLMGFNAPLCFSALKECVTRVHLSQHEGQQMRL